MPVEPLLRIGSGGDLVRAYASAISRSLEIVEEKNGWPSDLAVKSIIYEPDLNNRNQQWEHVINGIVKAHREAEEVLNQFRTCRQSINVIMGPEQNHSHRTTLLIQSALGQKIPERNRRLEAINIRQDLNDLINWWKGMSIRFIHLRESATGLTSEETLRIDATLAKLEEINSVSIDYNEKVMRIQDVVKTNFPEVVA